jgi:hypothetical protein
MFHISNSEKVFSDLFDMKHKQKGSDEDKSFLRW